MHREYNLPDLSRYVLLIPDVLPVCWGKARHVHTPCLEVQPYYDDIVAPSIVSIIYRPTTNDNGAERKRGEVEVHGRQNRVGAATGNSCNGKEKNDEQCGTVSQDPGAKNGTGSLLLRQGGAWRANIARSRTIMSHGPGDAGEVRVFCSGTSDSIIG